MAKSLQERDVGEVKPQARDQGGPRVSVQAKEEYSVTESDKDDIFLVAHVGDVTSLQALLERGVDANETHGDFGQSALHFAADGDQPAAARLLVEYGADPNLQDDEGNAPLHCAVESCAEAVEAYLRSLPQIDLTLENENGETPDQLLENLADA